jgi:uncharacterized protein
MVFRGVFLVFILIGSACSTYYQSHREFNSQFESGNLEHAGKLLAKNRKEAERRARFLYFLNKGVVHSILGDYEKSNQFFEKAYLFGEDYRVNYLQEAAALMTNPKVTVYRGEDHEHLLLLYYKALNFLKMGQYQEALVECRRLNIRLMQLSDKYRSEKRYRRDAFIHTLMGIIYQADRDYNNAYIAYRNALEIYEDDYRDIFGVQVPQQLQKDLLRMAWYSGFQSEFEFYKEKFGMEEVDVSVPEGGELVFFWNNGLGPIKAEWSINFAVMKGTGGQFVFSNEQYGFQFPFYVNPEDTEATSSLSDLRVFRVAFPKYVERPLYFQSAVLSTSDAAYSLDLAEDINGIAFRVLEERMMAEFGRALLRVALKKGAEHAARQSDKEGWAALLGVVNAMTEQADTRNWQTLPHSIFYTRVPLKQGDNEVKFRMFGPGGYNVDYRFLYQSERGNTHFHTFSTLETGNYFRPFY